MELLMGTGFQNALGRILRPKTVNGMAYKPKVTTSDGAKQGFNAKRKGHKNHDAVDINYHYESGAPLGQNGINMEHPVVGSPVTGMITKVDRTGMGMITIEDSHGYKHILMHLQTINAREGDKVAAGQIIGAMGGRGRDSSNEYAQHVHYEIKPPRDNNRINPETHWDNAPEGKKPSSFFPWQRKTVFYPVSILDQATRERLKNLRMGITIAHGETLRREGYKVWRIERDGSTRGYFIASD